MLGIYTADDGCRLIVFAHKYGGCAIGGAAGIAKHHDDIVDIFSNPDARNELMASVIHRTADNVELGLLRGPLDVKPDMDVEILFVMAGYNMRSQAITKEVGKMQAAEEGKVRELEASRMQASDAGKMRESEASKIRVSIPARI